MRVEGKNVTPAIGFAFVRKIEANMTEGGIATVGQDSIKWIMVESAPYWVTAQGAKVEVTYCEGDHILPRPTMVRTDPRTGQKSMDGPAITGLPPGWPQVHIIALSDIVAVMRSEDA